MSLLSGKNEIAFISDALIPGVLITVVRVTSRLKPEMMNPPQADSSSPAF